MKHQDSWIDDFDYLTEGVKDVVGCKTAIISHLITVTSFHYSREEAIACVKFNFERLGLE